MKCPRCGSEMTIDEHRKIPILMCYDCGYMEGRTYDKDFNQKKRTNFRQMKKLNLNECVSFLSKGIGVDENTLYEFFEAEYTE